MLSLAVAPALRVARSSLAVSLVGMPANTEASELDLQQQFSVARASRSELLGF